MRRNPAKLTLSLGNVENAHFVRDQILLRIHDRHVHGIKQVERALGDVHVSKATVGDQQRLVARPLAFLQPVFAQRLVARTFLWR